MFQNSLKNFRTKFVFNASKIGVNNNSLLRNYNKVTMRLH